MALSLSWYSLFNYIPFLSLNSSLDSLITSRTVLPPFWHPSLETMPMYSKFTILMNCHSIIFFEIDHANWTFYIDLRTQIIIQFIYSLRQIDGCWHSIPLFWDLNIACLSSWNANDLIIIELLLTDTSPRFHFPREESSSNKLLNTAEERNYSKLKPCSHLLL